MMLVRSKKNEKKILIYGCGNVGARHLQGVVKVNKKITVYVYDISNKSIIKSKKLLQEVYKSSKVVSVKFIKNFNKNKEFDLVILATTATNRYSLIKSTDAGSTWSVQSIGNTNTSFYLDYINMINAKSRVNRINRIIG